MSVNQRARDRAARRERRWWIAVATLMLAVTLGAGFAQRAMLLLRDRGWLGGLVDGLYLVVAAALIGSMVKIGGRWRVLAVLALAAAVYLPLLAAMPIVQERLHFIEFGGLALAGMQALEARRERRADQAPLLARHPWLGGFLIGTLGGVIDELVQAVVPSRVFDLRDIGFNATGALLAVAAAVALRAALAADRRRRPR